jgi:hypothetical protein
VIELQDLVLGIMRFGRFDHIALFHGYSIA